MAKIHIDTNKPNDNFQIALNDWVYVSKINPDNIQLDREYQFQYLGMLEVISAQLWTAWRKEFSFPASWWDAFKLNLFPEWLLKKFPARIKKYSFAEVIPMLSKNTEVFNEQLRKNKMGDFVSVVRKPIENFERFPLF